MEVVIAPAPDRAADLATSCMVHDRTAPTWGRTVVMWEEAALGGDTTLWPWRVRPGRATLDGRIGEEVYT